MVVVFNSWNVLKEYKIYVKWHSDFLTKSELVKYYALSDIKKIGYDTYFTRNKTEQKIPIYEWIINQNKKI